MTLLELMVALVVTGLALVAGYAALSTVIDRRMEAKASIVKVTRAATLRRTIVDWLQHGQLQFVTGGAVPSEGMSDLDLGTGGDNDELRFVTTAQTPLRRDSTVVQLYVNSSSNTFNYSAAGNVPGLVAVMSPTQSALMASMQAEDGSSGSGGAWGDNPFPRMGGFGNGFGGAGGSGDLLDSDDSDLGSLVVPLDSSVTGLHVDYLVQQLTQQGASQPPQWIPSSQWTTQRGVGGAYITAIRLTLIAGGRAALAPLLTQPIVVPVTTAL